MTIRPAWQRSERATIAQDAIIPVHRDALADLIKYHGGGVLLTWNGATYDVMDVEFSSLAGGQHFAYAVGQQGVWSEVSSVKHIADAQDGTALYSITVERA